MEYFTDVDFVICLGDLVDHCGEKHENEHKLREICALIRSYGIPFYSLMGNHDCDIFTQEEFNRITEGCIPPFSFRENGKTFIFLNANYSKNGAEYMPGCVDWTDTVIPAEQIQMLNQVLSEAETTEAYVFIHQNLDRDVQWQHIVANAEEVRAVISASGKVRRVIQGHYHFGYDNVIDGVEYHTLRAMCEGEENSFEIMEI